MQYDSATDDEKAICHVFLKKKKKSPFRKSCETSYMKSMNLIHWFMLRNLFCWKLITYFIFSLFSVCQSRAGWRCRSCAGFSRRCPSPSTCTEESQILPFVMPLPLVRHIFFASHFFILNSSVETGPVVNFNYLAGAIGGNAVLMSSLSTVEVALASGKIVTWTWEKSPDEMRTLCCGLGMAGIVLSVTFQCIPLQRWTVGFVFLQFSRPLLNISFYILDIPRFRTSAPFVTSLSSGASSSSLPSANSYSGSPSLNSLWWRTSIRRKNIRWWEREN